MARRGLFGAFVVALEPKGGDTEKPVRNGDGHGPGASPCTRGSWPHDGESLLPHSCRPKLSFLTFNQNNSNVRGTFGEYSAIFGGDGAHGGLHSTGRHVGTNRLLPQNVTN